MSFSIKVYLDYVCPYSYLAEFPLKEAIVGFDVDVQRIPFQLRPPPQVTLRPEDEYLQRTWLLSVYPLARRMGVPIVLPRVSPQPHTELAFEGLEHAQARGKGDEYHDRVFHAFFGEEKDIGKIHVLTQIAGDIGMDKGEFRTMLESGHYRSHLQNTMRRAKMEDHVTTVPTFIIGKQKLVGLQTKDALVRAISRASGAHPTRSQVTPAAFPPPSLNEHGI